MAKPSKPSTAHKAWVLIVCAALAWSTAMTPIPDHSQHNSVGAIRHHAHNIQEVLGNE